LLTLGRHLIVELYGCDRGRLDDLEVVRACLLGAVRAVGATGLGHRFHRFAPQGVSGTVLIAESHLSIHTWPEAGYAAVDIYTCGGLDPKPAIPGLRAALDAGEVRSQELLRGLPDDLPPGASIGPGDVAVLSRGPDVLAPRSSGLTPGGGWFVEGGVPGAHRHDSAHRMRVSALVDQRTTSFQELVIFDTPVYGRVLALDGVVQLSTSDERT
jgi:S-adenosylmethionine decarboxylase